MPTVVTSKAKQEVCPEKDYICGPNEPKRGALQAAACVFTALRHVNPLERDFRSTELGAKEEALNLKYSHAK